MAIKVALEHTTTYSFDRSVNLGPHVVRLRPAPHSRTPIEAYSLRVEPSDHFLNWQQDPFGNFQARLVFPEKTKELKVTVDLIADMSVVNPFDFFLEEDAEHFPFRYDADTKADLTPYLAPLPDSELLTSWMQDVDASDRPRTIDFLVAINQRLANDIDYSLRMEAGVQTAEETLGSLSGSCRDSAWLLVHVLRRVGLAARFVSGYLVQLVADVAPLEGPSGPKEDFTDLHAWTEVYLPGAGWVGLDPTSGLFVGEGHIPLAATPTPSTAAPISGLVDEAEVEFEFSNAVTRIHEDPRVTKPYSDEQWDQINAVGYQVDAMLEAGDVRLTQGGEPTFVSVDDFQAAEWNIAADGPTKRRLAAELTDRLFDRFAEGGVAHHGQGKWYPGEALPRWQHALIWRSDGVPLWKNRDLLAHPGRLANNPATTSGAKHFAAVFARYLGLGGDTLRGAHEDPIHSLWEEALLPDGPAPTGEVDPNDPDLVAEERRRSLSATLDAQAGAPAGWVLPLTRVGEQWQSQKWTFRRSELFLLPGTSPIGYRLPIRSLQWQPFPLPFETSPFAPQQPLGPADPLLQSRPGASADDLGSGSGSTAPASELFARDSAVDSAADGQPASPGVSAATHAAATTTTSLDATPSELTPTAVCFEVRDGQLYVFLPPLDTINDAVDFLAALEATAAELEQPIVIEGYPIPSDPRLRNIMVAADPGVIEVNVPPASNWSELVAIVEGVDTDARLTRLGTEKFDLDGTHTGTGGGNHVTLGGPSPADSPLLRRPSLLRSMVTYWQHHPSLSYLFSGRFIGPSSQAPRVDEARHDSLYELETAFAEIDRRGDDDVPPWLIDRLVRHLLVDLTGNTHRAEFCVDKMFSPDSERGRWGVLELRAFEMPPHPRMALVQALLVRSIVARCWNDPYRHEPVRWGSALHDRYLLPWYAERDLHDVLDDLSNHGIDLDPAWFDPFLEFRFPRHGKTSVGDVNLELRGAIEPWHVLGEEASGTGMARYVDSSVERLQLRVEGFVESRHVVTCNGVEVPMTATDVPGLAVAGIRFKAWAPPSGLHPTIGVQSPLTFDVVDRWQKRSLGGCRYHVVHQGGLLYDSAPVNASEAESRRQTRFETIGHTPGTVEVTPTRLLSHREYPVSLDLRRSP